MKTGRITGLAAVILLGVLLALIGEKTGLLMGIVLFTFAFIGGLYYCSLPGTLPCSLRFPMSGRKGQKIQGVFLINQPGRLPIFFGRTFGTIRNQMTEETSDFSLTIHLMGREEGIAPLDISSSNMGILEITINRIELFGLFGIGRKIIPVSLRREIMILPDTKELSLDISLQKESAGEGEGVIASLHGFDTSLYQGVRPYREGDSLRQIHWKMTGKTEEYMVKELGEPAAYIPVIFLETTVEMKAPAALDRLMEEYISVSQWLAEQNMPHILCWKDGNTGDWNFHPIAYLGQLDECFELLLRTGFREGKKETFLPALEKWETCRWWFCVMSRDEEKKKMEHLSEMEHLPYEERRIQFINTYQG